MWFPPLMIGDNDRKTSMAKWNEEKAAWSKNSEIYSELSWHVVLLNYLVAIIFLFKFKGHIMPLSKRKIDEVKLGVEPVALELRQDTPILPKTCVPASESGDTSRMFHSKHQFQPLHLFCGVFSEFVLFWGSPVPMMPGLPSASPAKSEKPEIANNSWKMHFILGRPSKLFWCASLNSLYSWRSIADAFFHKANAPCVRV